VVNFSRKGGGRRDDRARAARLTDTTVGWRDPSEREREPLEIPEFGPYDIDAAPDDDLPRVDLGALQVPNLPGAAIQVEASPNGQIVRVVLEHQGTRLQLGAYAAPRTDGIWDEIRDEVRTTLLSGGAKVVEVDSDYGPALAARVGGTGGTPVTELRHLGIDGPRWFVHAVFAGPGAVDPNAAPPLWMVLRGLIVNRGDEPRPVKEILPLRLPPELAARVAEMAAQRAAAQGGAAGTPAADGAGAAPATSRPRKATGRGA
jgi:Protein of unknown function (DUF3710)